MRFNLYRRTPLFLSPRRRRKIKCLAFLFLMIFVMMSALYIFFERLYPNYIARIEIRAKNTANILINNSLSRVLESKYDYTNFTNVKFDERGYVTSSEMDVISMNAFKTDLVRDLQDSINNLPEEYIYIPLGSLFNKEVLSGIGPKIKIKTAPGGIAKVDFSEDFTSCGINQVKHKIYLSVSVTMTFSSATMYKTYTVNNVVPVAETVITGVVPNYYGGVMNWAASNNQ